MPEAARGRTNTRDAILVAARDDPRGLGSARADHRRRSRPDGVAKTTIYRRYRSKQDLALAVVLEMTREVVATEQEGDTRAHLIGLVDTAVGLLRDTIMGRVMQGLASDIATDPQFSAAFREQVVDLRVRRVGEIVQFGIERESSERTPTRPSSRSCCSARYHRLLLSGGPLDTDLGERIVDAVLPAFTLDTLVAPRPLAPTPSDRPRFTIDSFVPSSSHRAFTRRSDTAASAGGYTRRIDHMQAVLSCRVPRSCVAGPGSEDADSPRTLGWRQGNGLGRSLGPVRVLGLRSHLRLGTGRLRSSGVYGCRR